MAEKRVRTFKAEFRTSPELGEGVAEAYVTTWNDEYKIGRNTYEAIERSAFEGIADGKSAAPIFYEHDWAAGPIGHETFRADDTGLLATQTYYLDESSRARSVFRALKNGALREHSIGFLPAEDGIDVQERSGSKLERIRKADLIESSVVVRGANPNTETVSTRAVVPGAVPTPTVAPPTPHPAPDPNAAVHPATGLPMEEEKPTKATLMADASKLVETALELGMGEQIVDVVKGFLKFMDSGPKPLPPADPNAAPAAPAAPAPAARSIDIHPALLRHLAK